MMLPARYRRNPLVAEESLPLRPRRSSVEEMLKQDPTEAPDSENIVSAIRKVFPDAGITLTGGVIYHLALNDVIANFTEKEDKDLLNALLIADEALTKDGLSHYAVAIGRK